MQIDKIKSYLKGVIENTPSDWLRLTTHRLDCYNEALAKVEFLEEFEKLFRKNVHDTKSLNELPTAYDYIRLGHPLSSVMEWSIAKLHGVPAENVICFASKVFPILAVLRENLLKNKKTRILHTDKLPVSMNSSLLSKIYGYEFELQQWEPSSEISFFEGSTIFVSNQANLFEFEVLQNVDFFVAVHDSYGSVILTNGAHNEAYIPRIQHVRRRETIAMTPADCLSALKSFTGMRIDKTEMLEPESKKARVENLIQKINNIDSKPLLSSSGLSIQYAITMALIHDAIEKHQGKDIKIIISPNCYGGTINQVNRIADCFKSSDQYLSPRPASVEVLDLYVDQGEDMVKNLDLLLEKVAKEDAIPLIIAEIPTNPRVEVPELEFLNTVLCTERKTGSGEIAVAPVFIIDQTFCPNVQFLGEGDVFSNVKAVAYISGSKFPSGGLCNAAYCIANKKAASLMKKVEEHLALCNNEPSPQQIEILAEHMPSMNERIKDAYQNSREFVTFIQKTLPEVKINFVSESLANDGFTPSVFSLDLPGEGKTEAEIEANKRARNKRLIELMINAIPNSKNCVSYGQLEGSYWTVPATSTQGTTDKEHKDYIVRVAFSPKLDVVRHKEVFAQFAKEIYAEAKVNS